VPVQGRATARPEPARRGFERGKSQPGKRTE